jgi:hypothetical protein
LVRPWTDIGVVWVVVIVFSGTASALALVVVGAARWVPCAPPNTFKYT